MKYIAKNKWYHDLINRATWRYLLMITKVDKKARLAPDFDIKPLWVGGLFRSGTTITTKILAEIGFDAGPENHLLKDLGQRADWNPGGFYENYLFMDWSLVIFEELNAWGHIPPAPEQVKNYDVNRMEYGSYCYKSIVEIHDDRISNKNKVDLLRKYYPKTAHQYLRENFGANPVVKNPHFTVLSEVLTKYWPNSRFLVVFRNPDASINSAKKIVSSADYQLYINYYSRMLERTVGETHFFSYDNLISNPTASIQALASVFGKEVDTEKCASLVNPDLYRHRTEEKSSEWPPELRLLYTRMKELTINP